jgi:hypothetical protein
VTFAPSISPAVKAFPRRALEVSLGSRGALWFAYFFMIPIFGGMAVFAFIVVIPSLVDDVVSFTGDKLIYRIAWKIAIVGVAFVLPVLALIEEIREIRARRRLSHIATDPHPVDAQFIRVRMGLLGGATVYFSWIDPLTGITHEGRTWLSGTTQPFWLDAQRRRLLALADTKGHAIALDQNLAPVVLQNHEIVSLRKLRDASL